MSFGREFRHSHIAHKSKAAEPADNVLVLFFFFSYYIPEFFKSFKRQVSTGFRFIMLLPALPPQLFSLPILNPLRLVPPL